ncbi:hypothetical protein KI387_024643 [Taxus chinensis]|uniref:Response regulatory domain-containing protein n=1 Tax=Taxus chinensis TaxID=29808 RepID=A0AA38G405_TAXCH|nr:hypothetical protein KI387_024643 [Taxus chinensis]
MMILSMKKPCFSPKGLRVLLVDDNALCLAVVERMLQECHYKVTICSRISQAIYLLRENRSVFDIVLSECCLPEGGAFKLLEIAGLGLGLPVILMSENGETSVVMRGIAHGACDYLIKPIRMEELRNIWQHVVRRRYPQQQCKFNTFVWDDSMGRESSDGVRTTDSPECCTKKRKYKEKTVEEEEDTGQLIEDITGLNKARVHWTVQLHHQFVNAVNHLQIDKAVPKKILESMRVQGLTRENVASHLQKYRLYLRRMSGTIPEPRPVTSFLAAGDGESGGSMHIRQEGRNPEQNQCLSQPAALNPACAMDKATMVSLQQYRSYEQKRAVENETQSHFNGGPGIHSSSRKISKKNCSAPTGEKSSVASNSMAVKSEGVTHTARMAGVSTLKSQSSFTGSTGKTTVDAKEEKEAEIFSTWNEAENLFVEKFDHAFELPNLSETVSAHEDFMSSIAPADISDYLIDDLFAPPK